MISPEVGNLTSLKFLDLSLNQLSGQLLKTMSKLSKRLSVMHLKKNRFHGAIPKILRKGCKLLHLHLSGNQSNGTLPRTLVNCRMLKELNIGNNEMSGTFPLWMETLPEL